ncbi:MAG: hypothetical protein JJT78_16945 [Leptospira sp.]|nr:hypothetical protein [Leptospira sp.]
MHSTIIGLLEYCKTNKDVPFLKEMTENYEGLSERNIKELNYFSKMKLKGIQDLAKTLEDAETEEIESSISGLWFEFRSEWIRHNAVNNYNMVMKGDADPLSVVQSAVLSHLIGGIETWIPEDKLKKMMEIMVSVQYDT